MNKYIERLTKEWNQHGKIIIGVDFDDTISPWNLNNLDDCKAIINILKEAKFTGAYLVIFTACKQDRYEEIKSYCEKLELQVDSINQNPINLPYGNNTKIYANIFIDDRAGINEALETLQEAMYRQRAFNRSQIKLDDIG